MFKRTVLVGVMAVVPAMLVAAPQQPGPATGADAKRMIQSFEGVLRGAIQTAGNQLAKKAQIVGVWEWQQEWHGLWSFARRTGPARFEFTKDGKIKTSDNVEGTYEIAGDVLKGKLGEKAIALKIMRIDNEALVLYEGNLGVVDGRDRFSMRWFKKK